MLRNKAFGILILVLIAALVAGCGKTKENAQVVATYKDGEITAQDFDKFKSVVTLFNPSYEQMMAEASVQESMLKQLIAYRILNDRADKSLKEKSETKAKEQMAEITKYYESQKPTLEEQLKAKKLTKDDIQDFLQLDETARSYMGTQVKEADMKKEFETNTKTDKHYYDKASVRHILVAFENAETGKKLTKEEALKKAKDIQAKLNAGGDFAALAKEFSDDPGSKENGGLYADAPVSQWVEQFKKAAIELPLNKVSDPVETSYGYHVMKVEKRTEGTYDSVKDQLRESLAGQQMSTFLEKELPGLITKTNLPKTEAPKTDAPKTGTEGGANQGSTNGGKTDSGSTNSGTTTK
ncbi:peptidylprolyl isomerase [Paenibacillus gansuensis]|uniref:Peptidylprolyl isomerase n=1 Tax=Paenibacillus gansuensis TaxID=306542 RepID=A0ABW5P979_9BACL